MDTQQARRTARKRHETLLAQLAVSRHTAARLTAEIAEAHARQADDSVLASDYAAAIERLNRMVEELSDDNRRTLEDNVNDALAMIFTDKNLEFRLVPVLFRNKTQYRVSVKSEGVEGDIESFGYGIFAIIALVLKVVFNFITKRSPLIVLDEQLKNVSSEYVAATSLFLRGLAKDFKVAIILVTHAPRFAAAADHIYEVVPAPAKSGPGASFRRTNSSAFRDFDE